MTLASLCLATIALLGAVVCSERLVDQIEHVIIFMQENRPMDHYFGTLQGVRGFNDRTSVPLRSGFNAFHQPIDQNNLDEYMLPFRAESNKTNAMCMPAPEMYYPTDILMWNSGRMDSWNTARDPGMGMSYYTRADLPYYYTLYDNFVCGDQYFQSTFTSTTPNRLVFFSGSNGLSVGEEAILQNDEPRPGYNWTTMGEILEENNVSWRVYQQADNFDDNGFAWFYNYQKSRPGDVLFEKGMRRQRNAIEAFHDDLANNTLPQVSWIIAPTRKSEHATNHPCDGEDFTARVLETLTSFPDIYAKSLFILNYDEGKLCDSCLFLCCFGVCALL
jgi:phospholipase C